MEQQEIISISITILLIISEALASMKIVNANSICQLVINILKSLQTKEDKK